MGSPGGTLGLLKTLQKRRVSLQKRGWGRLADLGETFYEHQISDDKVSWGTLGYILIFQVSIKSLKHDKNFWKLFTSKEAFRASIIQVNFQMFILSFSGYYSP